ncbi:hypothetical protein M1615_01275 [Patescibacteria group bacterium]|nr:hypothetical protein [Patescibacteria group bacterium]MCL5010112.1 hypothetical protein [Patescibacteria group bacterium]
MFNDLITSKSRVRLLGVFLLDPAAMYHVRELVRRTQEEINAVRRELALLEKKGILTREPRANRVYYFLSKSYPFYFDLLSMGVKTFGLGAEILRNRGKLGKIKFAMFSGKFARRLKKEPDDVDFLVVGTVVLPELAALVRNEERRLSAEINYTAMSDEEFAFRKSKRDPFILRILSGSRVMLLGDEEDMLS